MHPIYLDHNATTPLHTEALVVYREALSTLWGNPSSLYQSAQAAKARIREARSEIAQALGATTRDIVFTSGGTESINWVLTALFYAHRQTKTHFISASTEHPATLSFLQALPP